MDIAIIILGVLGLAFGSFVNALVWRIHKKKDWVRARSQCVHCGKTIQAIDLIPVFSWLALGGRCRYCKKKIHWQYPVVELAMAIVFAASYYFWPGGVESAGDWLLFVTWLATSVGLMALLIYDFRWMQLPSKILYPTAIIAVSGRLIYLIGFEPDKLDGFTQWILSVTIASGLFLLLYLLSRGSWIGFGDVRLGLITGTVLADPLNSMLMIILASLLGVIFAAPSLITGAKSMASKLPYGPFLITATAISLIFGQSIIDWYKRFFIP